MSGVRKTPICVVRRTRHKVELGMGKGKKKGDKREDVKKRTSDMEIAKALKRSR